MCCELNRLLICDLQANVEMSLQAIIVLNQVPGHEDGELHLFATPTLEAGEWSASCPCLFIPRGRVSTTHWIGDIMGPRVGLDEVEMRKLYALSENRTPISRPSSPYPNFYTH
jgi:hypothetical protein